MTRTGGMCMRLCFMSLLVVPCMCLSPVVIRGPCRTLALDGLRGGSNGLQSALHREQPDSSCKDSPCEDPDPAFSMSQQKSEDQVSTAKMVDLAMQVQLNGIDVAKAMREQRSPGVSTISPSGSSGEEGRVGGATQEWQVGKLHLEACQIVMDECYDKGIQPLVEALEARVYEGDVSCAEQSEFSGAAVCVWACAYLYSTCRYTCILLVLLILRLSSSRFVISR
jgi:hypothetical protein